MRNFSEETNSYLREVYNGLEKEFNKFKCYEDFNSFNVSRFRLHNHLLFSLLEVTSNGIADAIQFIGCDHDDLKTEVTKIIENSTKENKAVEKLDFIDSYGLPESDIASIMSFKCHFEKLMHITLGIRSGNTRYELIQKFIGFYAEDYIRMSIRESNSDPIKTYDDEYWYAKFHYIGFRFVFLELFHLGFKMEIDTFYENIKKGRLMVAVDSKDKVLGRLHVIAGAIGVPYNVVTVELPILNREE